MVKIFCPCPIRSGSILSQKSEFSRHPAASAGDEEFRPLFQSIKLVDIVMAYPHSRCVYPPNTMNTVNSSFASRRLPAPSSPRPAWPARPDRAPTFKRKTDDEFEGLAAKPTTTKLDEAQNHQIHTSRLPRMIRNHMYSRLYQASCQLCLTTSLLATDGISHEGPRFFTLVQP